MKTFGAAGVSSDSSIAGITPSTSIPSLNVRKYAHLHRCGEHTIIIIIVVLLCSIYYFFVAFVLVLPPVFKFTDLIFRYGPFSLLGCSWRFSRSGVVP